MQAILALDIAKSTGWAVGSPDGEPRYGRHYAEHYQGKDIGRLKHFFGLWIDDMITVHDVCHLVFEAPFIQEKDTMSARKTINLAGEAERVGFVRDISYAEIDIGTNKKFFAGNGRASKYQMTLAARSFGWDPKNNDECDALGLWAYSVNSRHPDLFKDRKLQADMRGARA